MDLSQKGAQFMRNFLLIIHNINTFKPSGIRKAEIEDSTKGKNIKAVLAQGDHTSKGDVEDGLD